MSDPQEKLRTGDLDGALSALQQQVRSDPANAKHRTFLFQLLSLMGQWDRALTQLNVVADLDGTALPMAAMYREALAAEALRSEVFAGNRTPLLFAEPQQWIALMLEALRVESAGDIEHAASLRTEALAEAPAQPGQVELASGTAPIAFDWVADADSRLGPLLEVIMKGQYYWVPLQHVQRIQIEPPEDLRDLVWLPATFTWSNGGEAVGLIPTRYPGTTASDDSQLRLARRTDWVDRGSDTYHGLGQRLFATEDQDLSLLDVRTLIMAGEVAPQPD
ncbi:MAG: type VI secretion system accessory protein TagJ [Pseudomonadota bacterium]